MPRCLISHTKIDVLLTSWFNDYPVIEIPFELVRINLTISNLHTNFLKHYKNGDVGIWNY